MVTTDERQRKRNATLHDDLARLRVLAETPCFPAGLTTLAAASLAFASSLEVCQVLVGRWGSERLTEHARLIRHAATALELPDETQSAAAVAELRRLYAQLALLLEEARS